MIQAAASFSVMGRKTIQENESFSSRRKGIFTVADGFGGGEVGIGAARMACDCVRDFLEKEAGDLEATLPFVLRSYYSLPANVLFNAMMHANRSVFDLNRDKNVHEKGGASVIAALLDQGLLALASVGSCSAFLFRGGKEARLIAPRTYGRLLDPFLEADNEGVLVPLAALGIGEDLEPEIVEVRVQRGDSLVLATGELTAETRRFLAACRPQDRDSALQIGTTLKSLTLADNLTVSLVIF